MTITFEMTLALVFQLHGFFLFSYSLEWKTSKIRLCYSWTGLLGHSDAKVACHTLRKVKWLCIKIKFLGTIYFWRPGPSKKLNGSCVICTVGVQLQDLRHGSWLRALLKCWPYENEIKIKVWINKIKRTKNAKPCFPPSPMPPYRLDA